LSVDAAKQALTSHHFELVLSDFNLGEGGLGSDLALWLAGQPAAAHTKLCMLSGDDAPDALPPGVCAWLPKPRHAADRAWLQALEPLLQTAA
jgi:hypothetical protein